MKVSYDKEARHNAHKHRYSSDCTWPHTVRSSFLTHTKYKKEHRKTGAMCTTEGTRPIGDEKKNKIKSSLSSWYLRKEIYIFLEPIRNELQDSTRPHRETQDPQVSMARIDSALLTLMQVLRTTWEWKHSWLFYEYITMKDFRASLV
jgi:hypothetical protein